MVVLARVVVLRKCQLEVEAVVGPAAAAPAEAAATACLVVAVLELAMGAAV